MCVRPIVLHYNNYELQTKTEIGGSGGSASNNVRFSGNRSNVRFHESDRCIRPSSGVHCMG